MSSKRFSRVYIEISNICNLQCDFCPEVHREKKVMSRDMFQKVIAQVKDLTEEVTFHLMGEPMTHPDFFEFLKVCEENHVPVNLTTNGTLLKYPERAQKLLTPIIRQVNFSLQSFTSNFPEKDVMSYLAPIFEFTRRALEVRPDLYINYRLWNMGSREDTEMANQHFLKPIEAEFGYKLEAPVDVAFKKSRHVVGRLYLHFDSRFEWPTLQAPVSSESGYCYGLKSHFAIHADGTVVPCCLDKEKGVDLGNISALTVLEALNSDRARHMRQGFDQFKVCEELCKRCTFIRRFDSKVPAI
ncbi:MAG: radical SAM protein [Bdellovibrionales bacterium]|nr:radical SAM protein [Bdellovibrionales bacterium]